MQDRSLTMMIPIINGKHSSLEKFLQLNRKSILGAFNQSRVTQMASFIIVLPNEEQKCDYRLLFTAFYNGGDELNYLTDIRKKLGPLLHSIWIHCVGFHASTLKNADEFTAFVNKYILKSKLYSNAFPGISASVIRESDALRKQVDGILDAVPVGTKASFVKKLEFGLTKPVVVKPHWIDCTAQRLAGIRPGHTNDPTIGVETDPKLYQVEDVTTQNILTVIVPVKKPFLKLRLLLLNTVFHFGRKRLLKNPGKTGQIGKLTTIHFMRWTLTDGGRNLLFQSVYDGSWESYIDDFVDIAALSMNIIWGNCKGYPVNGAEDIEYFKHYIRKNQLSANVAYLAYPQLSVCNILTNLSMSGASQEYNRSQGFQRHICGSYRR